MASPTTAPATSLSTTLTSASSLRRSLPELKLKTSSISPANPSPPSKPFPTRRRPPLWVPPGPDSGSRDRIAANVPELLTAAGAQHHIDADLLASVVRAESGGHANAVSRTGARGLMQLMPGTAQQLGVSDAFRPDQNIAGGTIYLDQLLARYDPLNDTRGLALALAAYNAGPAAVDRYHGIPPYRETRAYVVRVMNEFKRRKLALEHAEPKHAPVPSSAQDIASLGSH